MEPEGHKKAKTWLQKASRREGFLMISLESQLVVTV